MLAQHFGHGADDRVDAFARFEPRDRGEERLAPGDAAFYRSQGARVRFRGRQRGRKDNLQLVLAPGEIGAHEIRRVARVGNDGAAARQRIANALPLRAGGAQRVFHAVREHADRQG